jgi:hypothetical protein
MNPSLTQMGDIKANKEKLSKAIDFAKKNPEHPDAVELRRRLERGMFNKELEALGKKPFPVQQTKIDLGKAMAGVTPAPMSTIPEPEKPGRVMETLGDVKETLGGVGDQIVEGAKDMYDIATNDDMNLAQKFAAGSGRTAAGAAGIIGELTVGAGKALLPQEGEDMVKGLMDKVATAVSETDAAKSAAEWYQGLSPDNKIIVDSLGGIAALITEVIGLKGAKVVKNVVEETAQASAPAIVAGAEVVGDVAKQGVDVAGTVAKAITPDTTGLSESLIANVNRINPTKRQEFRQMTGLPEEQWLRERGIIGTRETTVKQLTDNFQAIRKNVDEALEKIPGDYKDNRVTQVAQDSYEFAKNVESPEAGRMSELLKKAEGTGLTVSEINELKRFYERNIKVGYLKDPTKTAEAVQKATNRDAAIREFLFEVADKNGFDNLRQLNKEIQANRFLADEIAGKAEGQNANNLMSLTDWVVASPGIVNDPTFLAGFVGKKLFSTETVRAFAAKALAGFPEVKPLPRADLDEITKRAQELLKKQEDLRVETQKNALLADELMKSGFTMGTGDNAFITEMPIALTRNEQALLRAAKAKDEYEQILRYILDQKAQGNSVGEGFVIQGIDNSPVLNPQSRFDPYRQDTIDLNSEKAEPPKASDEY